MAIENDIGMMMYAVVRAMKKKHAHAHSAMAHELTMAQIHALNHIYEAPRQMKELAEEMHVSLPTLSALVDKLVAMDLVARQRSTEDGRVFLVVMTKKGEQLWKESMDAKKQRMQQMLSHLSAKDKKDLLRILTKLYSASGPDEA